MTSKSKHRIAIGSAILSLLSLAIVAVILLSPSSALAQSFAYYIEINPGPDELGSYTILQPEIGRGIPNPVHGVLQYQNDLGGLHVETRFAEAEAYTGDGINPKAVLTVWLEVATPRPQWFAAHSGVSRIYFWPYRIVPKTPDASPYCLFGLDYMLSTVPTGDSTVDTTIALYDPEVSSQYPFAEVYCLDTAQSKECYWKDETHWEYLEGTADVKVPTEGAPSSGSLRFEGACQRTIFMNVHAKVYVRACQDLGDCPEISKYYSYGRAIADPYDLYILPEYGNPDDYEILTLSNLDAPYDDPSSWVPVQRTSNDLDEDGYHSYVDCDDLDPNIHPGAIDIIDGKDNDCDGLVDNLFKFIDLGTLEGDYIAGAYGINNLGQVVGRSYIANGLSRAFFWTADDGMVELDTSNVFSTANEINDLGQIVGMNRFAQDKDHAFIWTTASGMSDLGTLWDGALGTSHANDINNSGQIVGLTWSIPGEARAFLITPEDTDSDGVPDLWTKDVDGDGANDLMVNLGTLGGDQSYAWGINSMGQVIGQAWNSMGKIRPFLITPEDTDGDGVPDLWNRDEDADGVNDLMLDLGTIDGGHNSGRASDINDLGQVVGEWNRYIRGATRAFLVTPMDVNGDGEPDLWNRDDDGDGNNDLMMNLGGLSLGLDWGTMAFGINNLGQVVGENIYYIDNRQHTSAFIIMPDDTDGDGIPDLWNRDIDNDGANDLMVELVTDTGYPSEYALDINDMSQVVGPSGDPPNNVSTAILWNGPTLTPAGTSVISKPIDLDSLSSPVTLTFDEVTNSGFTRLTITDNASPPPFGFRLGNPPSYYDLTTTTTYSGLIEVCIEYSGISYVGNEEDLRLHHVEGGEWIDITDLPVDTGNKMICGHVSSLSPFAVFEPVGPPMGYHLPFAHAGGPYTGYEGSAVVLDGSGTFDLDDDPLQYRWDFDGNGTYDSAFSSDPTISHIWHDDSYGVARLEVTDGVFYVVGHSWIEILNVEPSVVLGSDAQVAKDQAFVRSGSFTDPGADIWVAQVDYGDGSGFEPLLIGPGNTFTLQHIYNEYGAYPLTVIVTDDDGGEGSSTIYVVVYDPEAGFVTGSGWINSPEGAYTEDPSMIGKASFDFVSKYKKGGDTPSGNTEFQFRAGNLNFHADSYDWLVVTGNDNTRFKGTGTINGEGVYNFMIWACDNEPDTFRIKIWEEDGSGIETLIYDNGMNQEIGGGNIVIHTTGK